MSMGICSMWIDTYPYMCILSVKCTVMNKGTFIYEKYSCSKMWIYCSLLQKLESNFYTIQVIPQHEFLDLLHDMGANVHSSVSSHYTYQAIVCVLVLGVQPSHPEWLSQQLTIHRFLHDLYLTGKQRRILCNITVGASTQMFYGWETADQKISLCTFVMPLRHIQLCKLNAPQPSPYQ